MPKLVLIVGHCILIVFLIVLRSSDIFFPRSQLHQFEFIHYIPRIGSLVLNGSVFKKLSKNSVAHCAFAQIEISQNVSYASSFRLATTMDDHSLIIASYEIVRNDFEVFAWVTALWFFCVISKWHHLLPYSIRYERQKIYYSTIVYMSNTYVWPRYAVYPRKSISCHHPDSL